MEKIRWAPKVRQEKIWALYQSDARGALDEDLLLDVGYALFARCESILQIADGQVMCPRCGSIFQVAGIEQWDSEQPVPCPAPGCGWLTTRQAYHASIRHRELWRGGALTAFSEYAAGFPKARTPQQRMFAVDRLIHAFHWDQKTHLPNRPAANNLIEGSVAQVVDLLDRLSPTPSGPASKNEWRANIQLMTARRTRVRPPSGPPGHPTQSPDPPTF